MLTNVPCVGDPALIHESAPKGNHSFSLFGPVVAPGDYPIHVMMQDYRVMLAWCRESSL
jgi:hypothetical protein